MSPKLYIVLFSYSYNSSLLKEITSFPLIYLLFVCLLIVVPGRNLKALCMLPKCATTEPHHQFIFSILIARQAIEKFQGQKVKVKEQ